MKSIFLQAATSDNSSLIGVAFVLIVAILLFFALRSLFLWYYKLDVIAKNLQEQTELLKSIHDKLDNK